MLKKLVTDFAIVVMSLSFSYGSFNALNNGVNKVYAASKHHKINSADETIWQKIWAGLKDVQQ